MSNPEQPIDYRWLNLEAERFEASRHRLDDALRVGHEGPLYFRAIVSPQRSQVLIAGARRDFTDSEAIRMARRLSGLGCLAERESALNEGREP